MPGRTRHTNAHQTQPWTWLEAARPRDANSRCHAPPFPQNPHSGPHALSNVTSSMTLIISFSWRNRKSKTSHLHIQVSPHMSHGRGCISARTFQPIDDNAVEVDLITALRGRASRGLRGAARPGKSAASGRGDVPQTFGRTMRRGQRALDEAAGKSLPGHYHACKSKWQARGTTERDGRRPSEHWRVRSQECGQDPGAAGEGTPV